MAPHLARVTVAAAALLTSCATIRYYLYRPPPLPPPPAESLDRYFLSQDGGTPTFGVNVPGPELRALSVAVADLAARAGSPDSNDELVTCLARFEAHDAQIIGEEDDRWIIYVQPRAERCFDGGERLKDGDATYEVNKTDYRILSADLSD